MLRTQPSHTPVQHHQVTSASQPASWGALPCKDWTADRLACGYVRPSSLRSFPLSRLSKGGVHSIGLVGSLQNGLLTACLHKRTSLLSGIPVRYTTGWCSFIICFYLFCLIALLHQKINSFCCLFKDCDVYSKL